MLCANSDIILLQEHWLTNDDIPLLGNIHHEFTAYGESAIDLSSGIMKGRPYGGVSFLCYPD